MSLYINKCFKFGNNASKLVVFLHGYNGCIADIEPYIKTLITENHNILAVAPEAPIACEKNLSKKQWYSLWEYDKNDERRNPDTSLDNLLAIYDRYGFSLNKAAKELNNFIDELQKQYNIADENTYIIGFSQGAMLALYTSLIRQQKLAGCFMLSGVIAGKSSLEKEIKSLPDVYLFHGKEDITVNYKTLDSSIAWLNHIGISTQEFRYNGLAHKINDEEILQIAKLIS